MCLWKGTVLFAAVEHCLKFKHLSCLLHFPLVCVACYLHVISCTLLLCTCYHNVDLLIKFSTSCLQEPENCFCMCKVQIMLRELAVDQDMSSVCRWMKTPERVSSSYVRHGTRCSPWRNCMRWMWGSTHWTRHGPSSHCRPLSMPASTSTPSF